MSVGQPVLSPVLIVAAHPDDIESWCGGTVAIARARGAEVAYVLCTSGDKGTNDGQASSWEIARLREEEQRAAAACLGVERVLFYRFPDGELEDTQELRGRLVRTIRQLRPRLLITFDPEHPYPAYIAHRDHRVVGRVALDAAYPYARDRLHFPEQITREGLTPHAVEEIWLMATTAPDFCVDITAVFDEKIRARLAHASQVADAATQTERLRRRDAALGEGFGVPLAEVFKRLRLPD
jgi:LmbE family N-acetylglucosaminyl deacetylase